MHRGCQRSLSIAIEWNELGFDIHVEAMQWCPSHNGSLVFWTLVAGFCVVEVSASEDVEGIQVAQAVLLVLTGLGQVLEATEDVALREILRGFTIVLARHAEVLSGFGQVVVVVMVAMVAMVMVMTMMMVMTMVVVVTMMVVAMMVVVVVVMAVREKHSSVSYP